MLQLFYNMTEDQKNIAQTLLLWYFMKLVWIIVLEFQIRQMFFLHL